MSEVTCLDELFYVLKGNPTEGEAEDAGLPTAHGECDWTSLPTFGGAEPKDTTGIWSWDETRMIVGTCADDIKIVRRPEFEDAAD